MSIRTSCEADQQATVMAYAKEAMKLVVGSVIIDEKQLTAGQTSRWAGFTKIYCGKGPDEKCELKLPEDTWEKRFLQKERGTTAHN